MARSVPLSRFTLRVGGGSAFVVRHHAFILHIEDNWCCRILLHCILGIYDIMRARFAPLHIRKFRPRHG
jgi:hypothetical protein